MNLSDVPDEVFSEKIMGDGFAILLNDIYVIAPFSGEVKSVFPTGHAIVLEAPDGMGVLIHLGLSTHRAASLYKPIVKAGQLVQQGDTLIKVNLKRAKRQKVNLISPIIFLTKEKIEIIKENKVIERGESDIITIYKLL